MPIATFLLQRLAGLVGVLLGMSLLIFGIIHILPGNVAYAMLGEFATPDAIARLEQKLGLHDPLWLQYWRWLRDMLHGDFGQSLSMSRPAWPVIADALTRSALLAGISFLLVATLGIAFGAAGRNFIRARHRAWHRTRRARGDASWPRLRSRGDAVATGVHRDPRFLLGHPVRRCLCRLAALAAGRGL